MERVDADDQHKRVNEAIGVKDRCELPKKKKTDAAVTSVG